MMQPRVNLQLDVPGRSFRPGQILSGQFAVEGVAEQSVRAVELSVLWHTEGKGEEDLSVHFFQRLEPRPGEAFDLRTPRPFNTVLPNSPLSYRGLIVKICWCVRIRVFLHRGKELSLEVPFQLGHVPHPQLVTV